MQQAFKTMMGQMDSQNNQFSGAAFSPGSPFPFPMPPASGTVTSPSPAASQPMVTVDVPATNVEAKHVKVETEVKTEPKKYGKFYLYALFSANMIPKSYFECSF